VSIAKGLVSLHAAVANRTSLALTAEAGGASVWYR